MRLSLFFLLHLVAFVILIIVHPHARAQDDGWAIIEKDKNFIYMSKNGEFIHGDRIVLSLNYKDCDTVYHLFTFLTTKGDANIYQFENKNIPIKINNFDFFAEVTHIEKILDHRAHWVVFKLGSYNSKEYAQKVSKSILEWASKDMYSQTRTYPKYSIIEGDRFWKPTPPDYMDGIEPHWPKIRTMVLDSSNQFPPKDPIPFDLKKGSPFYKQLMEVYDITKSLTEEQTNIAKFWDCNPYVSHHKGHAMFATKKITPGGHWIGITAVATRKAKSSFEDTINAYVNVSITLFDAFISCWDEKWETLVVRPETLINQYYDEDWIPLLQTPPFPEYTSGHSVISRAAALTLTDLFGENFNFVDTTEVSYGLPSRSYKSFINASEEAAISRLYGGIHYMMAITEGVTQGQNIGNFIVKNIQTKKCL